MNKLKTILIFAITLLIVSSILTGCNTIRGAGEDIQEGGEAIERAAD
jgi:entericidin B